MALGTYNGNNSIVVVIVAIIIIIIINSNFPTNLTYKRNILFANKIVLELSVYGF